MDTNLPTTLVPILSWLALTLWMATAWRYLYHILRFFQMEEYKPQRFWRVLQRLPQERNFLLLVTFMLVGLAIAKFVLAVPALVLAIINAALALLTISIQPFAKDPHQRFNATPRATRLLATGLLLTLILLGLGWLAQVIDPNQGRVCVGAVIVWLTPLLLPLANVILWPVEEAIRNKFLRQAEANLQHSGATVIALTGSFGKTSTKHYLKHILDSHARVVMTPRSFNTLMGISRAINEMLADGELYDYFIVEAGAYIPGEIARICQLVKPHIGMVITVGPMHLERFGTIENVAKAKYEIIAALPKEGVGIFNADDPNVLNMAQRGHPDTRLLVTQTGMDGARLSASNIQLKADGTTFTVRDNATSETMMMNTPLFGSHNITNILLAMAVARQLGMSMTAIADRVVTLQPAEHRLVRTVLPNGIILIDDAYSANPIGTQMALQVLAAQGSPRRVVLTSGMFELGPLHEAENRKLGQRIADVATDVILLGAAQTVPVKRGLQDKNFPSDHLFVVTNLNEAIAIYQPILQGGDSLLLLTDLPDTYA